MAKLTKTQLKTFRFFRDKGFGISEARRLAKMRYHQLADELSTRLREQARHKRVIAGSRISKEVHE